MTSSMSPQRQKSLGAYYTSDAVAEFLSEWAIRQATDTVLEPSFGGGAFLRTAITRLRALGGQPNKQIFGFELDPSTYLNVTNELKAEGFAGTNLVVSDYFAVVPKDRKVTAVIGNPPFIRYQRFTGNSRQQALLRAAEAGVELSEISSSWAPFVVHTTSFLETGGRLAMVLPLELLQANYARPVLRHLRDAFQTVRLLTFDRRLFPDLNQDTLLVLASGYGCPSESIRLDRLLAAGSLVTYPQGLLSSEPLDQDRIDSGDLRAALYRIKPEARSLYEQLTEATGVSRLGSLADVGIGYVTGANEYFHLSNADVRYWNLRPDHLVPAIRRGRDFHGLGLALTESDWQRLSSQGGKYWLFYPPTDDLGTAAQAYISLGEQLGVPNAYKCRVRRPWWRVPGVSAPDLLLTVMANNSPRLIANEAAVVATNTLHTVRLTTPISSRLLAAASCTTLTQLSAEIEGHALGGGMLKLEPSEATRLLLPVPRVTENSATLDHIGRCLLTGDLSKAQELADQWLLHDGLGLSNDQVGLLQTALAQLRAWRTQR